MPAERNTPPTMSRGVAPTAMRMANSRRRLTTSRLTRLNKPSMASANASAANSANTHALNRHGAISLLTTSSSIEMPLTRTRGSLSLACVWMAAATASALRSCPGFMRTTRLVAALRVCIGGSYNSSWTSASPR
jgi:hypothetical protein